MTDLIFAGGTVVTAEASYAADVAVSGGTIEAVGVDLPHNGAEVVADRATRAPAERAVSAGLVAAAQKRGLLVGRNVDTAAGLDNVIALAPPLSMTAADADHIVETLGACFAEHSQEVHA